MHIDQNQSSRCIICFVEIVHSIKSTIDDVALRNKLDEYNRVHLKGQEFYGIAQTYVWYMYF